MRKFIEWEIKDRFPNEKLESIYPLSLRAFSLVSRQKNQIDQLEGAPELLGLLNMMEALDYHFDNFIRQKHSNKSSYRAHEMVAYLNRVGQIYYFVKSEFLRSIIDDPLSLIPIINDLKVFRMKNTSHRSIDYPKEESIQYRSRQSLTFLGFEVNRIDQFETYTIPIEKSEKTEWCDFTPELDHPKIMNELIQLLESTVEELKKLGKQ